MPARTRLDLTDIESRVLLTVLTAAGSLVALDDEDDQRAALRIIDKAQRADEKFRPTKETR